MLNKSFRFGKNDISVCSENTLSDIEISQLPAENGILLLKIRLIIADPQGQSDISIIRDEPLEGVTGFWAPCKNRGRYIPQSWYPQNEYSTLTDGIPLVSLFSADSNNYRTYALSEAEKPFELSAWLKNDPGRDTLRVRIRPFINDSSRTDEFSFYLRIDERRIPLADCVGEACEWQRTFYPAVRKEYSEDFAGAMPLFSSWYACFQNPEQQTLERELPFLAELGFRSMIIDDGWSYDGRGNGAYSYCGAWEVSTEKFPDMAGFVEKAHRCGIRVALWFPVPFIGEENPDYELFSGKMLGNTMGAGVLDPRFPETRDYIVKNYVKIINKYGFDGLKLDFLTDFNRPAPENRPGTDCETINEGVTKLLASIEKEVCSAAPDMMIEYREHYFGPSVIRHCNMLRVGDCAFDFITNRNGTVDLRMLGHPLAVHSDMLLWGAEETPENIAVMLLNVMFSVPQISVLTASMNEKQRNVIGAFLSYWTAHRDILLHGRLTVKEPQANYTLVSAENDVLRISVIYSPRVISFDEKNTDIFNASDESFIFVDSPVKGSAVCRDIFGEITSEISFGPGAVKLSVSPGGRASIVCAET